MSKLRMTRMVIVVALMMVLSTSAILVQGQENLLQNPGFENGFITVSGEQPRSVAIGWTSFHMPRTSGMPSFQNAQPKYIAASAASGQGIQPRIRSGSDAQIYYSFFETHDGGIYQQVSVPNGAELRFSIYAHVWSSTFDDVNVSEDPGGVVFRVGIDPLGGTDPNASSVVYSAPAVFYDTFRQYSVIATAQRSTVTVFVRSSFGDPVQNTYIYLDDAVLELTEAPASPPTSPPQPTSTPVTPTATPTDVPTEEPTEAPTEEPTEVAETDEAPTDEAPTDVPPTDVPPTAEPATAIPTNTVVPTASDPTPTRETGALLPTATPIGVIPTSVPGDDGVVDDRPISEIFPGTIIHTVRSGDTVGGLAMLYGSTTEAIIQANGLGSNALIFRGQGLVIPVRLRPMTATPTNTPIVIIVTATEDTPPAQEGGQVGSGSYVVQRGDTLSIIARRFNTTVATLVQLNGIANPNRIFVGQRLTVPGADSVTPAPVAPTSVAPAQPTAVPPVAPAPQTYVVRPGDTLFRLAARFGVPIQRLADVNGIFNYNLIFIGQVLTIPQ